MRKSICTFAVLITLIFATSAEARMYLAVAGRWMSRDPVGETSDPNLYRAMANNAINKIDPFGLAVIGERKLDISWLGPVNGYWPFYHQQIWFDNSLDGNNNLGFFGPQGKAEGWGGIRPDNGHSYSEYFGWSSHYDDALMRQAVANVEQWWGMYYIVGVHDCQTFVEAVISEYNQLKEKKGCSDDFNQ